MYNESNDLLTSWEKGHETLIYHYHKACSLNDFIIYRLFIVKLGHKWTLVVCIFGYMTWMAANGYAGKLCI